MENASIHPSIPPRRNRSYRAIWLAPLLTACILSSTVEETRVNTSDRVFTETPTAAPSQNLGPVSTEIGSDILQEESGIQVFFTEPSSGDQVGGPASQLINAIDQANQSIDVAAYNLTLPAITSALVSARQRGVQVRIVTESDNLDDRIPEDLPVKGDENEALMHDKFMILDGQEVWTGSMNFSAGGAYNDNNNLVHLHSQQVARDYTVEFEEMYLENLFGADSYTDTPYPSVQIGNIPIEIYFSPDDGVQAHLIDLLESAESSIYVMAYSFTADPLREVILDKADDGIVVGIVLDKEHSGDTGSEYTAFQDAGLDVRLDGNSGLMHHKVIIVDGQAVAFGSYNFTASAEKRNDENLVIVHDDDFARQFLEEYSRIAAQAQ